MLNSSIAANTKAAYRTAITVFCKFRNSHTITEIWPAPITHITLFIANCFEKGCAASTITTYMAGISFYHKVNGWRDPFNSFLVKKLLEGCKRMRPQADTRAPVTLNILEKILTSVHLICYSQYESTMFKAAFSLAYYGLFRISELVYTHKGLQPLSFNDLRVENGATAIIVTIKSSKANKNPVTLRIPSVRPPLSCPVHLISSFLKVRPTNSNAFFLHSNGLPLTRYQFSLVLKKVISSLGMGSGSFKTHSFRIGRATQLAIDGLSEDRIRVMGRWQSDSYKSYIRTKQTLAMV